MTDAHEESLRSLVARGASALAVDVRERDAPVTALVVASTLVVFVVQAVTAVRLNAPIGVVTASVFVSDPVLAWVLSPLLHRDLGHLVANVVVLAFVGTVVEPHFRRRDYVAFLLAAAVLAGLGGYLSKAAFTGRPVTAYGASGLAYAVAGYALGVPVTGVPLDRDTLSMYGVLDRTTPGERVAAVFGVAAAATVLADVATGPYLSFDWLNGAHLVGLLVGVWTAWTHRLHRRRRDDHER